MHERQSNEETNNLETNKNTQDYIPTLLLKLAQLGAPPNPPQKKTTNRRCPGPLPESVDLLGKPYCQEKQETDIHGKQPPSQTHRMLGKEWPEESHI